MNPILALIVVIGILSSIASKKKKEEMKRKAQQPPNPMQQSQSGKPVMMPKTTATNRQGRPASAAPQNKKPAPVVDSKWPWPTAAEKAKSKPKPAAGPNYGGMPRYTHVVQSTLEGGHTHTESSMTGEEACPPPQTEAKGQPVQAPAANAGSLLSFEGNSVLQGILYAEILGKPKALQRK